MYIYNKTINMCAFQEGDEQPSKLNLHDFKLNIIIEIHFEVAV